MMNGSIGTRTLVAIGAGVVLCTAFAGAPKAEDGLNAKHWGKNGEPATVSLAAPSEPGFHGRVARLEMIDPDNAAGEESRTWTGSAWRNERVHAQFVVWSGERVGSLRAVVSDLKSASGGTIPASAIDARFVRNVLAAPSSRSKMKDLGPRVYGDILDRDLRPDLPRNGYRVVWLTVKTPEKAPAGLYRGGFKVVGNGGKSVEFKLELELVDRTLPNPKDWKFYLNLWQHPMHVAKYHRVKPYSKAHFQLMVPLFRELADAGQKVIYTYIQERPWFEDGAYRAQVLHVRKTDGSFAWDYTLFDRYVEFSLRTGIGPFIECSTIARRHDNQVVYVDEATGDLVKREFAVDSPEADRYWGAFLEDFEKHLKAKGWFGNVYIDLDELKIDDTKAALGIIRRHAPGFKTSFACDKAPAEFLSLGMEHYSQAMRKPEKMFPPEFWTALAERRKDRKFVTTFYVCNLPGTPNTWVRSEYDECQWQGLFAAAKGFDGFLRWAVFHWGFDPLWDASFPPHYDAGEGHLFYPGMRSSPRWEMLRDSFENFEKIRILRETGGLTPELEAALAAMTPECVGQYEDEAAFAVGHARARAQVEPVLKALDAASRK